MRHPNGILVTFYVRKLYCFCFSVTNTRPQSKTFADQVSHMTVIARDGYLEASLDRDITNVQRTTKLTYLGTA